MKKDSSTEIAANIVNTVLSGDQQFWLLIANFSAILLVKISLIFVAAMTIYLGYKLLVQGVKGEFKFNTEMQGVKADLVSASPGTFFVLLGVIVLIVAIQTKYSIPVEQKASKTKVTKNVEQKTEVESEWLSKDDPFSKNSGN
jgi:hypothetical protein